MARGMAYKFIRSHPCGMFALNWEIVVNLCEGSREGEPCEPARLVEYCQTTNARHRQGGVQWVGWLWFPIDCVLSKYRVVQNLPVEWYKIYL